MAQTESKVKPVEIDPNKATPAQIAAGLAMLGKSETRKKRIQAGELKGWSYKDMPEERKEEMRVKNRFSRIKRVLMIQKAEQQGITVTDKEVQAELAARGL